MMVLPEGQRAHNLEIMAHLRDLGISPIDVAPFTVSITPGWWGLTIRMARMTIIYIDLQKALICISVKIFDNLLFTSTLANFPLNMLSQNVR